MNTRQAEQGEIEEVVIRVHPDNLTIDVTSTEYRQAYERALSKLTALYSEELERQIAAGELEIPPAPQNDPDFNELLKRSMAHQAAMNELMLQAFLGGHGLRGIGGELRGIAVRFVPDEAVEFGKHQIDAEDPDQQMVRFRQLFR